MCKINNLLRIILLGLATVQAQGIWENMAPLPASRAGHAVVAIDSLIYLIGGFENSQHHTVNTVWVYDPASDTWNQSLPPLNNQRGAFAAVTKGDTIYVFGGRHMSNLVAEVERYVIGSPSWEVISTMPQPRMGLGAAILNDQIYLFGGKSSRGTFALPTDRVDIFNPADGSWSIGGSMNRARTAFGYAQNNDGITCAGGSLLDPIRGAEEYSYQSGWTEISVLPESRSNCAAVYRDNSFILLGGYTSDGINGTNLIFDNGLWLEFPAMLLPRYDHTAVVLNNDIYIMGGRNGQYALSSQERYSITAATADTYPGLQAAFSINSPYPNPFNGTFTFEVLLPIDKPGLLDIKLYDITGGVVINELRSGVSSGDRIRINMSRTKLGSLSSGIYILRVTNAGVEHSAEAISRQVLYLK